ncbi:MAG: DUF4105 domain-containing protein [Planctomycetota bacterium]
MAWIRGLIVGLGRAISFTFWILLGAWVALAVYYTVPLPGWLVTALAIGIAILFVRAQRERFRFYQWFHTPWRSKRFSASALVVTLAVSIFYFGFVVPDPNVEWAPEQARHPVVEFDGDKVRISNIRNFTWRTATDFTPGWYDREYDLNKLETMYYVVVPLPMFNGVAHVFVCFGFSDGKSVAVSVEGRRMKGQRYELIPSMFRQFQLVYVVGDERDVVGIRGAVWKKPVFFYPARTTQERKRWIFVDMMKRAHSLEDHPEFYHLITNNCMNNILYHLRRLGGRPLPHDLRVLMTGLSDRVAYNLGYIDTDLPFEKARLSHR